MEDNPDQHAALRNPREPTAARSLDVELLFRLEMTARQVRGLFAHRAVTIQNVGTSGSLPRRAEAGPAWGGQALRGAISAIHDVFVETARAPTWGGSAAPATAWEREGLLRARMLAYPAGRAIFMPLALQDGEERFFTIVVGHIAQHQIDVNDGAFAADWLLQNPEHLQQLFELARCSQIGGMDPALVALAFLDSFTQ